MQGQLPERKGIGTIWICGGLFDNVHIPI